MYNCQAAASAADAASASAAVSNTKEVFLQVQVSASHPRWATLRTVGCVCGYQQLLEDLLPTVTGLTRGLQLELRVPAMQCITDSYTARQTLVWPEV